MTDDQIKHMAERFCGWKIPVDEFHPDGGITFKRTYNDDTPWPAKWEPTGTNLFTVSQAKEMVRYMIEGLDV